MSRTATLPLPLSSFVGREPELAKIGRLLRTTRLLTLLGPGGIGKTRLALETAQRVGFDYDDAVALIDLSGLSPSASVAEAIADAVGVQEQTGEDLIDTMAHALRSQRRLLLVDNCEHVVGACAALTARLLPRCSELRILATSRVPFGVMGETKLSVPPLDVPDTDLEHGCNPAVTGGPVSRPGWLIASMSSRTGSKRRHSLWNPAAFRAGIARACC